MGILLSFYLDGIIFALSTLVPLRVGPLCGGFGFLCNPHTHSSWKEEDSSIHFSIPPSPSHLVILYLGKAALLCTWLISNQLWPPTTSSSSSYHHFKQIFFVLFWFPKVRNDRFFLVGVVFLMGSSCFHYILPHTKKEKRTKPPHLGKKVERGRSNEFLQFLLFFKMWMPLVRINTDVD